MNCDQLTPERVRSATFTPSRLGRRGLDEAEVHAFCQWVAEGLGRLRNDNASLREEVMRLRERLIDGRKSKSGVQPADAHVQAVYVLSKALQTADRYVADAQEYSRKLAEDARLRRDEILLEAKMRASMILDDAHAIASQAASASRSSAEPLSDGERQELQAEIAQLRTYSDACRTHLQAYLEPLTHSIEEWERAQWTGTLPVRAPVAPSPAGPVPPARAPWHDEAAAARW